MRTFENPWRRAHEMWATGGWILASLMMFGTAVVTRLPSQPFLFMFAISVLMAVKRGWEASLLWKFHADLSGKPVEFVSPFEILKKMRSHRDSLWLGYGFEWTPVHTQRAIEVRKLDIRRFLPPEWYMKLKGLRKPGNAMGAPWLHGIGLKEEEDVYVPLETINKGNTLVLATTRAIKTRLYEILCSQALIRGEVLFVFDPKGDRQLRESLKHMCELAGTPERFVMFHPAFPKDSARIDVLANYNRPTEIASRIIAALPTAGDSFGNFCWEVVNAIAEGLIFVDRKPSLLAISHYVGNPDALMEEVLIKLFREKVPGWESRADRYISAVSNAKGKNAPQGSPRLAGYIEFYRAEVPDTDRDIRVDRLMQQVTHNREHYGKMIVSLTPLLTMLTAGELGPMLSPDYDDVNDRRPIFNSDKIIAGRHVVYVGLDSLSDTVVSGAMGSMMIADLAAVAGARYNFTDGGNTVIQLLIDEAAEVVNEPLVQILNKGGGANFQTTIAAQTVPDFITRLGSEEAALKVLGNCNTLIAGRTKDMQTQKFISDTFGKTHVQQVSRSLGTSNKTEDHGLEFGGSAGESVSETQVQSFPPELLGMIPNLQYVAFVQGGRLIKGRIPILDMKK